MSNETSIMKRRSFLMKAGCGLAGILTAGKCPATIIKKLIGNTGSMMSDSDSLGDLFDNPYITDGLVAMYDGEWNTAIGVHKSSTSTWKNLTKNSQLDFNISGMIVGDNYVDTNYMTTKTLAVVPKTDFTIECVACTLINKPAGLQNNNFVSIGYPPYGDQVYIPNNANRSLGYGVTGNWLSLIFFRYSNEYGKSTVSSSDLSRTSLVNVPDYDWTIPRHFSGTTTLDGYVRLIINGENNIHDNGKWPGYLYDMTESDVFEMSIGKQLRNSNNRLFNIRIYNRYLEDYEVMYNYSIDHERFGVGVI